MAIRSEEIATTGTERQALNCLQQVSWTAKKQLGEVHAARVGETRLLLRESKVLAKNRVHWSVQVYRMMLQSSRKENINITRVFTIVAFLGFD